MKIKKLSFERSSKYVIEKHKPIIPTIIFWGGDVEDRRFFKLKFAFWRWWVKIGILIVI